MLDHTFRWVVFIKQIKSTSRVLDFSFPRICAVDGVKFFVSVIDTPLRSYHFTMQKGNEKCKVDDAPKLSKWITNLEPLFARAVEENEAGWLGIATFEKGIGRA